MFLYNFMRSNIFCLKKMNRKINPNQETCGRLNCFCVFLWIYIKYYNGFRYDGNNDGNNNCPFLLVNWNGSYHHPYTFLLDLGCTWTDEGTVKNYMDQPVSGLEEKLVSSCHLWVMRAVRLMIYLSWLGGQQREFLIRRGILIQMGFFLSK